MRKKIISIIFFATFTMGAGIMPFDPPQTKNQNGLRFNKGGNFLGIVD